MDDQSQNRPRAEEAPVPNEAEIKETKQFRKDLDDVLQCVKYSAHQSRERALSITKIQEAIMWLGMDLKELAGGVSNYKHGYDPTNANVDAPYGVKL